LEAEQQYQAVKHQQFVGTGYFDKVAECVAGGTSSTTALHGSTEEEQFVVPSRAQHMPQPVPQAV
jgi:isocitrate lyase